MTNEQHARVTADWSKIAGEAVTVESIGAAHYAFGSELATLRLFNKFHRSAPRAAAGYSDNLGKFYFRLESAF